MGVTCFCQRESDFHSSVPKVGLVALGRKVIEDGDSGLLTGQSHRRDGI
jgi:hypothetical protein